MNTYTRTLTGVFFVGAFTTTVVSRPPDDQTIEKVLVDWAELRTRTKVVRYTMTGKLEQVAEFPKPEPGSGAIIPNTPKEIPVDARILIDAERGRTRVEETTRGISQDNSKWIPEFRIRTYDKTDYRTIRPRERNEPISGPLELAIGTGNLAMEKIDSHLWPPYIAHGIVPTSGALLRVDRFPTDHDPNDFRVAGTVVHRGRPLLSLKTDPPTTSHEIWVEPTRRGLVHRLIRWAGGGKLPSIRIDLRYREDASGPQLDGWTHSTYMGGKLDVTTTYQVVKIEREPAVGDAAYTISAEVGMMVTEYDYPPKGSGLNTNAPRSKQYLVEPGNKKLAIGEPIGFKNMEGDEVRPAGRTWLWWSLVIGGVLLVAAVWVYRRRSRSVSGPAS